MAYRITAPRRPFATTWRLLPLALALGGLLPWPAGAQATAPQVKAEINALLARLQASGCQFNRNGAWYPGTEAAAHLGRKFAYVDAHGGASSAEQFIDLAASKSSISGQPYLVRCGATAPVESNAWLKSQLAPLRKSQAEAKP